MSLSEDSALTMYINWLCGSHSLYRIPFENDMLLDFSELPSNASQPGGLA